MRNLLRRFVCFALGHMYGVTPTLKDEHGEGWSCLRCERSGIIVVYGHKSVIVPLRPRKSA